MEDWGKTWQPAKRKIPKSVMVPLTPELHRQMQADYERYYLGRCTFPEYTRMLLVTGLDTRKYSINEDEEEQKT